MKFAALILLFGAVAQAQVWTAEAPLKAKVVSYDRKCVQLRGAGGTSFKVRRESLKGLALTPGKTEIRYFKDALTAHLCG